MFEEYPFLESHFSHLARLSLRLANSLLPYWVFHFVFFEKAQCLLLLFIAFVFDVHLFLEVLLAFLHIDQVHINFLLRISTQILSELQVRAVALMLLQKRYDLRINVFNILFPQLFLQMGLCGKHSLARLYFYRWLICKVEVHYSATNLKWTLLTWEYLVLPIHKDLRSKLTQFVLQDEFIIYKFDQGVESGNCNVVDAQILVKTTAKFEEMDSINRHQELYHATHAIVKAETF